MLSYEYIQEHYLTERRNILKRYAFRSGSWENAEDILQTAYERALRYRASCLPDMFESWFARICYNSFKDFMREERGYTAVEELNTEEDDLVDCNLYTDKIMKEVFELIDTKSLVQQEVLNLYFKQEYTATDISKITDYTYAQCHQIIQRFRNELKEIYKR